MTVALPRCHHECDQHGPGYPDYCGAQTDVPASGAYLNCTCHKGHKGDHVACACVNGKRIHEIGVWIRKADLKRIY